MFSTQVTAVVLSGGKGTRLRSLHPLVPKPLVPVAGKPFLYWITAYLVRHGVHDIIYSTGHLGDQISDWCVTSDWPNVRRRTRREPEPLGTAGGLLNCLDMCAEWIVVSNGDSLCLGGMCELLALISDDEVDAALVAASVEDTSRFGTVYASGGRLLRFEEKKPGRGFMNAGVYAFRREMLERYSSARPSSIEYDLIPRLLKMKVPIGVIPVADAPFIDIGTPEAIATADAFITAHKNHFTNGAGAG